MKNLSFIFIGKRIHGNKKMLTNKGVNIRDLKDIYVYV